MRLPVVFEDNPVKFKVLQWERKKPDGSSVIDWERLGDVRNWVKLGFRVTGVRVVKTSKNVIVHPGALKGFDVDALEVESGRIVERVRYILEVKFGMQLAEDCEFLHGPMWQVYHPDAKQWLKTGSVKVPGFGALDASPKPWMKSLSKVPHVEFENKQHAAIAATWPVASDPAKQNVSAAPMYPYYLQEIHRTVVNLAAQVEVLTCEVGHVKNFERQVSSVMDDFKNLSISLQKLENLEKIGENLQSITGILSKLFVAADNGAQAPANLKGSDYVA